jgi:hypothetical protein
MGRRTGGTSSDMRELSGDTKLGQTRTHPLGVSCCPGCPLSPPGTETSTIPIREAVSAPKRGGSKKSAGNLMDHKLEIRLKHLRQAPRCGARTRAGGVCQRPAIRGRTRCRLHGGLSPGAPRGAENGNFRNGNWTADAIEERRWLRSLVKAFALGG